MNKKSLYAILLAMPVGAVGFVGFGCRQSKIATAAAMPTPNLLGADCYEIMPLTETPVEVESERILYSINKIPSAQGDCLPAAMLQYRLKNPTEENETLRLVLPLGKTAEYRRGISEDYAEYRLEVDGEPIESTLRYTFSDGFGRTVLENAAEILSGREDSFYTADRTVTEYSCSVTLPESVRADQYELRMEYGYNASRTKIYSPDCYNHRLENGKMIGTYRLNKQNDCFAFYVIGETAQLNAAVTARDPGAVYDKKYDFADAVTVRKEETVTLAEFLQGQNPCGDVSDSDWFCCGVDLLKAWQSDHGVICCALNLVNKDDLCRWLEYRIDVPARQSVTHTVRMPLYPTISSGGACYFHYYLSPAQQWSRYGGLEVKIATALTVCDSSLTLEKEENGYRFSQASLPLGDLKFKVVGNDHFNQSYSPYDEPPSALTTALILLSAIVGVAVVSVVTITVLNKRKRKKISEANRRRNMCRVEEGKVNVSPQDERSQENKE